MLPSVEQINIGFSNHFKLGCWTPVHVKLSGAPGGSGEPGRIDVQARDGDDVPAWYIGPKVIWPQGATRTAYVRIGRADGSIKTRLTKLGGEGEHLPELLPDISSAPEALALPATNEFIVQIGASIGLPEMFRRLELPEPLRADVVTIDHKQPFPDQWFGYEGVDLLVIAGAPAVDKSLVDTAAVEAIDQWIQQGGTLVISCGDGAERVFGSDSPLRRFAPGEFAGTANLSGLQLGAIENFARAEKPLDATSLRVPQWQNVLPRSIELSAGVRATDTALVVRSPRGFGQVIFVGLDLDKPPLGNWSERTKFLEHLLGRRAPTGGQSAMQEGSVQGAHFGFVDLSGQLRGALDQFADVRLIPFWLVAVLALFYIGALSGLSYWIVVRWLKRPALAWAVLPALVVLFCAVAIAVAHQTKGNRRQMNQLDVVDIDLADGRARGTTWFNIFSPTNALFDLRVQPDFAGKRAPAQSENAASSSSLLGWMGLPGSGLGGMNSRVVNLPLFDEPYEIDPHAGTIAGVPLSAWSSKSFVARWDSTGGGIESKLSVSSDGRLHGEIVNRLDVPLGDCVLLFESVEQQHRGWAFPLQTLAPGQAVPLDHRESQNLEAFLTKRRIVSSKDEATGYDRGSFDVGRIVEMMMFHERAGATNYTGLLNRYQNFLDLSSQLKLGRAILVGRGPAGATVKINNESTATDEQGRQVSIYRFVLPVKPATEN